MPRMRRKINESNTKYEKIKHTRSSQLPKSGNLVALEFFKLSFLIIILKILPMNVQMLVFERILNAENNGNLRVALLSMRGVSVSSTGRLTAPLFPVEFRLSVRRQMLLSQSRSLITS